MKVPIEHFHEDQNGTLFNSHQYTGVTYIDLDT